MRATACMNCCTTVAPLQDPAAWRKRGALRNSFAISSLGMEPVVGFEPTTDGLQNRCSTTELNWPGGGMNRQSPFPPRQMTLTSGEPDASQCGGSASRHYQCGRTWNRLRIVSKKARQDGFNKLET